jgi:hypothetical protein
MFINLPKEDTLQVAPGSYSYDITWLSVVSDPGNRHSVQQGSVSFVRPVTLAQS